MGLPLPKPVMTEFREHYGNSIFRCGSSCVNGYRDSMEDAHIAHLKKDWGFFGVFDGHVNDQCSLYLSEAWEKALQNITVPVSDERLAQMALEIDQEWMNSGREGGSTGTFFFAMKEGNKVKLQVGNVGDSRVIARIDGHNVSLTTDHKPNNEKERLRIEEFGGRVENNRVDGCLAVSRAFGDRDYKSNSGGQLEQKVIALADVTHATASFGASDFVVLCCDGVFESNFTNEEVVDFIAEQMKVTKDLTEIATRVCAEAIDRGSRDNISCMILQFQDGTDYSKEPHFIVIPGPFSAPANTSFRRAYEMMATKAGMSVGEVLERRFDDLQRMTEKPFDDSEVSFFKDGPPATLKDAARTEWFNELFREAATNSRSRMDDMERFQYLQQQVGVPMSALLSLIGHDASEEVVLDSNKDK